MAAAARLFVFYAILTLASAHPTILPSLPYLVSRDKVILNNASGSLQVFDPATQYTVAQSPATDGSGSSFDPPALIWIGFGLFFGLPMACAGIRGWRLTTGTGIGLAAAVCCAISLL